MLQQCVIIFNNMDLGIVYDDGGDDVTDFYCRFINVHFCIIDTCLCEILILLLCSKICNKKMYKTPILLYTPR